MRAVRAVVGLNVCVNNWVLFYMHVWLCVCVWRGVGGSVFLKKMCAQCVNGSYDLKIYKTQGESRLG